MKSYCIIVDDEPLARTAIATLLSRFEGMEVIAECQDTFEALKVLQTKRIDLMFLDIQMPEVSGLDFLRSLKNPPPVILTTAHRQYALEGFELDVVDYLLKPVSFERMMKALDKFYHLYQKTHGSQGIKDDEAQPGFLTIRADRKNIRLRMDDILWISSLKDYVQVYTSDQKYITQLPIGELEEQLPGNQFLRVHRSYIVNLDKVTAFTGLDVEIGKTEIPIGRSYKSHVNTILSQHFNS